MMGSLSKRYARALMEIAREEDSLNVFGDTLEALLAAFRGAPDGLHVLADSLLSPSQRLAAITEIAEKMGVSPLLKHFLMLLVQKERIGLLPEIVREFGRSRDEILGIVRVNVFTPKESDNLLLSQIEKILSNRLKKKVVARGGVRPDMIGGLILEIDHMIYDGSIQRDLERVRERLLREPIS